MHADLDLLCISVYCTADDLLPERPSNARRRLSDAEIVTLCVAQVLMGIPSDRRFLRAARRQLGHLFPLLPSQDALHKRRSRLAESIEWLIGVFAAQSPGSSDDLVLLDSTPVECGRSVETTHLRLCSAGDVEQPDHLALRLVPGRDHLRRGKEHDVALLACEVLSRLG
jgi:hypothetical protein